MSTHAQTYCLFLSNRIKDTPLSRIKSLNISHLRCVPVGVRFMRLRRIYRTRNDGRHKCRPYKDLKGKFLYYELSRLRRDFFDRINKIFLFSLYPEHPWPRPGFAGQVYTAPVRVFYGYPSRLYASRARAGLSILSKNYIAFFSFSTRSVLSQVNSSNSRPKCP